jgi:hypothetical protein
VEPVIISRLQRTTAAQLAQERARALWRQRALRILVHAVVVAVGLRVLLAALQPCLASYRATRDIHSLRGQLQQEADRNRRLQRQKQFLMSNHGVEEEARRLGWTRPGEVSLQILTPEPPPKPKAVDGSPPSPAGEAKSDLPSRISVSERIRLAVTRWLDPAKK